MIYKTLKKVSEYCQLLDKRNFPATQTVYGVTFTNNGDGSITVDGTCTSQYYSSINLEVEIDKLVPSHTYIFTGNASNITSILLFNYPGSYIMKSNNNIFILPEYEYTSVYVAIRVVGGNTASNVTTRPQLFDLTEMYGAGHEPTTVEEFKEKFPNELYDYKPYCFVKSYKTLLKATDNKIITSYKKSLICTTKNLFDISKVPTISGQLIVKDNSICSYAYPAVINDTNLLSIFKSLKPDTNYTMSATTLNYLDNSTNHIVLIFSNALGDKIIFYNYSAGFNKVTFSLTQEQINNITNVYFYGRDESSGGPTMWSNIQLEEGSTATEYHPYGYL